MADDKTFTGDQFIDVFNACTSASSVPARQKPRHLPKIHPFRSGLRQIGDVTGYRYTSVTAPDVAGQDSGRITQDQDPPVGALVDQYIAAPIVGQQRAAAIRQKLFSPDLLQVGDAPTGRSSPEEVAEKDRMLIDGKERLGGSDLEIATCQDLRPLWSAIAGCRSRSPRDVNMESSGHQIAKIG
ncbi:hypothetical protein [Sphingopyxis indica]|uniref:hypothetical protein n=1 Tax=Sphingopyxis indica TaxID=436663 RepID=UPI0014834A91|nr:hypothetical protein [Sphingopyxis indica]